MSTSGVFLEINQGPLSKFGMARDQFIGKTPSEVPWPVDSTTTLPSFCDACARAAAGETVRWDGEFVYRGKRIVNDIVVAPLRDVTGNVKQLVSFAINITARRRAQEELNASLREKEVLLREVHHRVKNNMQMILSLLYLQSRRVKAPAIIALLDELRGRVHTMSLAHELLYCAESLEVLDAQPYIKAIVQAVAASFRGLAPVDVEIDVASMPLDLDAALPVGLVVNELVLNAMKHAFPGRRRGRLRVAMRAIDDGRQELVVGDDGVGLPANMDMAHAGSLGMRLVTKLVEQLGAELLVEREPGTTFIMRAKLAAHP
jgi:PAS domain S-box-containing protein